MTGRLYVVLLPLLVVGVARANLLCSGSDDTCQAYLAESTFYAQSNVSNFVFDFFSQQAKSSAITSKQFPDSGIMVTDYSASQIPTAQLGSVDFAVLFWWMPKASISLPHFHSNAVEWGFVTKGMVYMCLVDMSKYVVFFFLGIIKSWAIRGCSFRGRDTSVCNTRIDDIMQGI